MSGLPALPAEMELVEDEPQSEEWLPGAKIPGYNTRFTPRGIRVVEIDIEADPVKRDNPAFIQAMRRKFPNDNDFRREIKRDWTASAGDIYFPEFIENGGTSRYVHPVRSIRPGVIYRGFDFGIRKPAVVWFQYSPKQKRAWVLRSLTPSFMPAHDFRDLTLYLSGQLPIERLMQPDRIYAWAYLQQLEADPMQPAHPWFKSAGAVPLAFADYAGPEARYTSDLVEGGKDVARSRAEVFEEGGIYLQEVGAARDRDTITRKLLAVREDGWPGLLIDPSNELLISALGGGLVWKPPTLLDPLPEGYYKDGIHDNVYEAFTYGAVGVIPVQDALEEAGGQVIRNREIVTETAGETLGFHEVNRSNF